MTTWVSRAIHLRVSSYLLEPYTLVITCATEGDDADFPVVAHGGNDKNDFYVTVHAKVLMGSLRLG